MGGGGHVWASGAFAALLHPPLPPSLVIETLREVDPTRKCYRMVGGILVERTVKEVLPALESNKEQVRGGQGSPPGSSRGPPGSPMTPVSSPPPFFSPRSAKSLRH